MERPLPAGWARLSSGAGGDERGLPRVAPGGQPRSRVGRSRWLGGAACLWALQGAAFAADPRAASPPPSGISGPNILDVPQPAGGFTWERFTFFPALSQLDREFHQLMLRAAYAGDIAWGAAQIADSREDQLALYEQQILAAQIQFDTTRARYDECKLAAARAERLLRKFERPDDEMAELEAIAIATLSEAWMAERAIWEDMVWPDLTNSARDAWEAFAASLQLQTYNTEDWARALLLHQDLERFRSLVSNYDFSPAEREAFSGAPTEDALNRIMSLALDDRYRVEQVDREKYQEAIQATQQLKACEREFITAEEFLKQQRQKKIRLESLVSQGSGDALAIDARRIADRYAGVLGEVQLVDAYLTNRQWTDLWWKAGVALRLAGDDDVGAKRIAQAAAVADDHRLPSGAVPGHLEAWLREAENEILRRQPGFVRVHTPVDARLTVDGRDVVVNFGEAELSLAQGVHRLVMWVGKSDPIMRLVGIVEGETTDVTWYESSDLTGEDEEVLGPPPTLPTLAPPPKVKRWHIGASAIGGATLGRPGFGAGFTVRYFPKYVGFQVGGAALVPVSPYWIDTAEEMSLFVRVHGGLVGGAFVGPVLERDDGLAAVGRIGVIAALEAYVDPLLGAGPMGTLEVSVAVTPGLRVGLDGRFGWDVTAHMDGIPRWNAGGALSLWF